MLLTRSPLSRRPKPPFALDLHVLGTPPALILSQDQTLQLKHPVSRKTPENEMRRRVGALEGGPEKAHSGTGPAPRRGWRSGRVEVRRSGPKARPEIPARSSPARTGGPGPLPASAALRRKALRRRHRVRPVDVRIDLSSLARLSSLCLVEKEPRCPVRRTVSLPMACSSCQAGKNRAGAGGVPNRAPRPGGWAGRGGRGRRAPGRRARSSPGRRRVLSSRSGVGGAVSRSGRLSRRRAGGRWERKRWLGEGTGPTGAEPAGRSRPLRRAGGGLPAASGAAHRWLYSRRLLRRAGSRRVVVPSPGSVRLVHLGRFGSAGSTRRWRSPAGAAIGRRHMEVVVVGSARLRARRPRGLRGAGSGASPSCWTGRFARSSPRRLRGRSVAG